MNRTLTKAEIFDVVSVLKALAITMVVFLHMDMGVSSKVFADINFFLRPFRMPVFMFASGFLYFYVTKDKYPHYGRFVTEKFKRLLVPFFFIKITYTLVKYLLTYTNHPNYFIPQFNLKVFLLDLLFFPTNDQSAIHLWFVYALFIIFIIVHLFSSKIYWLIAISLVLFFIPMPQIFGLDSVRTFLFFFCLGGGLQKFLHKLDYVINPVWIGLSLVTGLLISVILFRTGSNLPENTGLNTFAKFLIGVVVVLSLSTLLGLWKNSLITRVLRFTGSYSASIYFLHTFCYRFFALIVYRFYAGCSDLVFWILMVSGLLFGVYGPILLDKYLISRSKVAGLLLTGKRSNLRLEDIKQSYRRRKVRWLNYLHIF